MKTVVPARFNSLSEMLDIKDRYFTGPGEITKRCDLLETYDRNKHNKIISMEKQRSMTWLKEALQKPKDTDKTVKKVLKKECCRMWSMLWGMPCRCHNNGI